MTTRSSLIAGCLFLGSVAAAATSDTKTQLRLDMRKLWDDHAAYTRSYVISAIAGLPDTDAVAQRLLRNQDEIGNAIKPYYGEEAGRKLATLLRDHIKIASEVVKAAKAGQTTELNAAQSRWSQKRQGHRGAALRRQPQLAEGRAGVDASAAPRPPHR
jgi:hypothetical protein